MANMTGTRLKNSNRTVLGLGVEKSYHAKRREGEALHSEFESVVMGWLCCIAIPTCGRGEMEENVNKQRRSLNSIDIGEKRGWSVEHFRTLKGAPSNKAGSGGA